MFLDCLELRFYPFPFLFISVPYIFLFIKLAFSRKIGSKNWFIWDESDLEILHVFIFGLDVLTKRFFSWFFVFKEIFCFFPFEVWSDNGSKVKEWHYSLEMIKIL